MRSLHWEQFSTVIVILTLPIVLFHVWSSPLMLQSFRTKHYVLPGQTAFHALPHDASRSCVHASVFITHWSMSRHTTTKCSFPSSRTHLAQQLKDAICPEFVAQSQRWNAPWNSASPFWSTCYRLTHHTPIWPHFNVNTGSPFFFQLRWMVWDGRFPFRVIKQACVEPILITGIGIIKRSSL